MSESKTLLFLGVFLIIVGVIAIITEVGILGYAYFTADEIECNWIWCTFKSGEGMIEQNTECFQNGVEINCSEVVNFDSYDVR